MTPSAKVLGNYLRSIRDIDFVIDLQIPLGKLVRLGKVRSIKGVTRNYQYKKNIFELKLKSKSLVAIYFSGEDYGPEIDFFRKMYENTKNVYSGTLTQFTSKKITPKLIDYDDGTMTLIIAKASNDLTNYSKAKNTKRLQDVHLRTITLFKDTWKDSKRQNDGWPRYIDAFLNPNQYDSIKNKSIDEYLTPKTANFYVDTQRVVQEFVESINGIEKGFGFSDLKPDNLAEDDNKNILYIDVGKPGFGYHWLTLLGIYYQGVVEQLPNTAFSKVLKKEINKILTKYPKEDESIKLFVLGRVNRFLLPSTLWNIAFLKQVNIKIDENDLLDRMGKVKNFTKINKVEYAITFAADAFEDNWKKRLKFYSRTKEHKDNLKLLKKDIDQTLPRIKPKKNVIFIYMGIPGSGKTAISNILLGLGLGIILQSDWIYFTKLKDQLEGDYYKAYVYLEELTRYYLKKGYSVICDDNSRTLKVRQTKYAIAKKIGVECVLISIDVNLDTAARRVTLKGGGEDKYEEHVKRLAVYQSQMEYPSKSEQKTVKIIRIDGKEPLEKIKSRLREELIKLQIL